MGFFGFRQPTYMYQSPSGYIFRLRIPKDLKPIVGKCEFRYSLRAGALRVAKHRAMHIASFIHQLFKKVRNSMSDFTPEGISKLVKQHIKTFIDDDEACNNVPATVTPGSIIVYGETLMEGSDMRGCDCTAVLTSERINQLVQTYIRETLDNDEKCRAIAGTISTEAITLDGMSFLESSNMDADEAQSLLKSVTRWTQQADHSLMFPVTEKILRTEGVIVGTDNETYHILSRELLKAFQSVLSVRMKRSTGDYSVANEELVPTLKQEELKVQEQTIQTIVQPEESKPVLFSEVRERFVAEAEHGGNWTERTKVEYLATYALFERVVGDIDVKKIDRTMMSNYKSTLLQLPSNLNKKAEFKGKTIEEIVAMKPKNTLAVRTVNTNLTRIGSVLEYAMLNGYINMNPATGLKMKIKQRADEDRLEFSQEDLEKLFYSPDYTNGTHKHPHRFWTPLMALYTGCRLEEICQLHLEDIREEGGVWVFDLNKKEEKHLKNLASARLVPIHPHLIDLGLLIYVEKLKSEGQSRLFPELSNKHRGNYGHSVTKWFKTYKESCGIASDKKPFHSFRHTFTTHLKKKQVDFVMREELVGHAIPGEGARYGKRFDAKTGLEEVIKKIDYGLDFSRVQF